MCSKLVQVKIILIQYCFIYSCSTRALSAAGLEKYSFLKKKISCAIMVGISNYAHFRVWNIMLSQPLLFKSQFIYLNPAQHTVAIEQRANAQAQAHPKRILTSKDSQLLPINGNEFQVEVGSKGFSKVLAFEWLSGKV